MPVAYAASMNFSRGSSYHIARGQPITRVDGRHQLLRKEKEEKQEKEKSKNKSVDPENAMQICKKNFDRIGKIFDKKGVLLYLAGRGDFGQVRDAEGVLCDLKRSAVVWARVDAGGLRFLVD
jgi:hypothetical protein